MVDKLTPEQLNSALDELRAELAKLGDLFPCPERTMRDALDQLRAEHAVLSRLPSAKLPTITADGVICLYCTASINSCDNIRDGKTCRERARDHG